MIILYAVVLIVVLAALFVRLYPPFGAKSSAGKLGAYSRFPGFADGKFHNLLPTSMGMNFKNVVKVLYQFTVGGPNRKPSKPIGFVKLAPVRPAPGAKARVAWLGHSAVWVEIAGKTLFLDPMLGKTPSPFPVFGGNRYSGKLPLDIEDLPTIDAIILSHDHYDHLDYGSIRKLMAKTRKFIVPLGVAAHLEKWGVDKALIEEHGWGDEFEYEELKLACAPARHFSGRGPTTGRDSSLWCSWIIDGGTDKVFFSGDSGYGPHFKEIGERYGPFDLTLMECGQYDPRWQAIHMLPEETVQAHLDVRGGTLIPIHWGAFTLAVHSWYDPAERATNAAEQLGVRIATPRMGEFVTVGASEYPTKKWWIDEIKKTASV